MTDKSKSVVGEAAPEPQPSSQKLTDAKSVDNQITDVPEICQNCHQANPIWFAPNDIWNAVVEEVSGILCPVCFINRAERQGFKCTARELRPENAVTAQPVVAEGTTAEQRALGEIQRIYDACYDSEIPGKKFDQYIEKVLREYGAALRGEIARLTAEISDQNGELAQFTAENLRLRSDLDEAKSKKAGVEERG